MKLFLGVSEGFIILGVVLFLYTLLSRSDKTSFLERMTEKTASLAISACLMLIGIGCIASIVADKLLYP